MSVTVEILGLPEVNAMLDGLPAKLQRLALRDAAEVAATVVLKALRDTVPVEGGQFSTQKDARQHGAHTSGELRDSLDYHVNATKDGVQATIGIDMAFWGSLQEYGWLNVPGKHWFGRAWEASREKCYQVFKARLEATVNRLNQEGK